MVLKPYSTFALSESEESNGYTLLCRAMPEEDLVVELLHFDPDNYRLEHEIRDGRGTVTAVEALTHDIRRLELEVTEPAGFDFLPGQYVDVWIPGADDARRSFSMANLPGRRAHRADHQALSGRAVLEHARRRDQASGDELRFTGPYGAFHLRDSDRPILMVAGGSGMAPVLSLLRSLAEQGSDRTGALLLRRAHRSRTSSTSTSSRSSAHAWLTSSSCP